MKRRTSLLLLAVPLAALHARAAAPQPRTLTIDANSPQGAPGRREEVEQALQAWKLSWELGQFDAYQRFYAGSFQGDAGSRAQWEKQRRQRMAGRKISVDIQDLRIRLVTDSDAEVRFVQHYKSPGHSDSGDKRMRMRREGGAWRIVEERWVRRR